jgi:hypothetical protein
VLHLLLTANHLEESKLGQMDTTKAVAIATVVIVAVTITVTVTIVIATWSHGSVVLQLDLHLGSDKEKNDLAMITDHVAIMDLPLLHGLLVAAAAVLQAGIATATALTPVVTEVVHLVQLHLGNNRPPLHHHHLATRLRTVTEDTRLSHLSITWVLLLAWVDLHLAWVLHQCTKATAPEAHPLHHRHQVMDLLLR